MKTWERAVTLAGTVATLAMAIDFYVLRSKLTTVLAAPVAIPTAGLLLAVVLIGFVVLLARAPLPRLQAEIWRLREEKSALSGELSAVHEHSAAADAQSASLQAQVGALQSELDKSLSLRTVVAAVLVKGDADEQKIMNQLKLDYVDPAERSRVLAAVGSLIEEGRVTRAKYLREYHWVDADDASSA